MPERVVIGGGVSRSGEQLLGPVRAEVDGCSDGCPIGSEDVFLASAGDDAGLMGAYVYARDLSMPR